MEEGKVTARRRLFAAHALAWALCGLVYFLAVLPFQTEGAGSLALFKVVWSLLGWAVSGVLAYLYGYPLRLREQRLAMAAVLATAASVVAALGWVAIMGSASLMMIGSTDLFFTRSSLPFVAMNHVFILLAWSGAYLALAYWQRSQAEETKSALAIGQAREAQLEMLRYQLNPHFLFNALASLRALILEDPERARATVTRLSAFLRYSLGASDRTWSTLAEEVAVVRSYLEIERVRFDETLAVEVDTDATASSWQIPSFLLHALVENAVKHGSLDRGALRIRICTENDRDKLLLKVENTGHLEAEWSKSGGIGLSNVRARLQGAFPDRHSFLMEEEDGWVRATIEIEGEAHV